MFYQTLIIKMFCLILPDFKQSLLKLYPACRELEKNPNG